MNVKSEIGKPRRAAPPARQPVIGIAARFNASENSLYLGREYGQAVAAAGGVPFHFGLIPDRNYIGSAVELVDGIVLPGNDSDVDPLRFDCEPQPGIGKIDPLRDEIDLMILAEAERRATPLLGICYGMQILNVFRGGTLIQDIERRFPAALVHRQGAPRERLSHRLIVEKDSRLALLEPEPRQILVNSHHHQAIERVGRDLKATAAASDGIIEAIEDTRADRFALGIQWHPELLFQTSQFAKGIFEHFVGAAQKYKISREATSAG